MRKIPLLLCALSLLTTAAHAQKIPVKVTDMLKIKTVGDVHLSRDGSEAVFTLTTIEPDSSTGKNAKWDYKYLTQLYLIPTDASTPARQLTTAKEGASQPAWEPHNNAIAFVRNVDGKPQIFLLSLEGGEPTQLTHFRYGASSPKWSPDGKRLLFSARINLKELIKDSLLNPKHHLPAWTYEKPGITGNASLKPFTAKPDPDGDLNEIRAYLDNNATDKKAKVVNKLNFQDEMEVNPEMVFTHWFVMSAPGGAPEEVTHGFYSYNNVDFLPGEDQLIISAHIDSTQDPERGLENEIYTASDDGSNPKLLFGEKNKVFGNAYPSPDSHTLAYTESPTSFVSVPELKLIDLRSKTITSIPFDRAPSNLTWSTDSRYLYFIAQSNGGAPVYRLDINTHMIDQLTDDDAGATSLDESHDHILIARTSPHDPSELFKIVPNGPTPTGITTFNTPWLVDRQLSLPEHHTFKNSLGETIDYWVMKPIGYKEGQHYPLLLDIHGGPSPMWGPGEPSMWHEFQYFCGKGYGVVYCNPRGSGGYGLDFLRANVNDWGTGPTSDVLTALDKAVAEGWADTSKLVVSGGSYAGYLTAWIVGHDHRFKAACAQRGVYDLATFFGEGNAWRLVPNYFGGYPWEPETKAILVRESPITYVANITTPLIIFHGENDRRTGFVQGEMLYRSLKVLGRPVEYVRHPGATHEITRSGENRQRIDQLLRTWEFFNRYIH